MKLPIHAASLLIALSLSPLTSSGAEPDPKLSDSAQQQVKEKRAAIQAEIKQTDVPWAGDYYHGDGLGVNVNFAVAPKAGFAFEWSGCVGTYDRNYGTVIETNGVLHLNCHFPNAREGFQGLDTELIPVRWGDRRYLIPSDRVAGFCNAVNSGREPRKGLQGSYMIRVGDEKKTVTGFPELPARYEKYLLKTPITATIIAVGDASTRPSRGSFKFKDTEVTLDAGSKRGVLPGMELYVVSPSNAFESVTIKTVEASHSKALMTQIGEKHPAPEVGWKLSTTRKTADQ